MQTRHTIDRKLAAFWRNDGNNGFFLEMTLHEHQRDLLVALREVYITTRALLLAHPVEGKATLIREIEEFAMQHNAAGRPSYPRDAKEAPTAAVIIMKMWALENLGMIPSDEYNGVVASAVIQEHVLH